jgi:hypothetical protein
MSVKKKHRTANEYLHYLKGDLSSQERHTFEKELEADPFEKEALEGMESLTTDQVEEDILTLHSRLRKRLGKKRRIAWYSAAASIASLLIVGTVFLQIYDFNPEKAEKTLDEEAFNVAPLTEQAESMTAEEDFEEGVEETTREVSAKEVSSREISTSEVSTNTERRDEKGPANVTGIQVSEAPVERAPYPETPVEEALPQEAEAIPVETEAVPLEGLLVEEEVEPMEETEQETETGKRSNRRSKQLSQPSATQPMETQKKASSQADYARLVSRQVSGVVISAEDMEPLPGASVAVKGSNTGVVTDMNGIFTLPVLDDSNRTLVASFVGMETQEYQFDDDTQIRLVMQPDALTLNEVVMVDQGIQPSAMPAGGYTTDQMKEHEDQRSGPAQPSGGFKAFKQYMEASIKYPDVESTAERAVVILRFTVKPSGDLTSIIPLRSPGEPFTQEAIRLIKEGPSWNPAFNDDGKIEEIVQLRIVFKK